MNFTADELQQELERLDATMSRVVARAGHGSDPVLDRLLSTHVRVLRLMLDADGGSAAEDAADAARRAMESADPAAPLLMLTMAREALTAKLRREALRASVLLRASGLHAA